MSSGQRGNTLRLVFSGKNKTVKQMSQEWVLRTMDKLIKKNPSMPYSTIKKFIIADQYRARLFRLKPLRDNHIQITIYKIKNKGLKAFSKIKDTQLKPIDMKHPKNSFEIQIVQAYNQCRKKYLHKYLNVLNDSEINTLLQDNYIQKIDVQKVLKTRKR